MLAPQNNCFQRLLCRRRCVASRMSVQRVVGALSTEQEARGSFRPATDAPSPSQARRRQRSQLQAYHWHHVPSASGVFLELTQARWLAPSADTLAPPRVWRTPRDQTHKGHLKVYALSAGKRRTGSLRLESHPCGLRAMRGRRQGVFPPTIIGTPPEFKRSERCE